MLEEEPKLKHMLTFALGFMALTQISGCENTAQSVSEKPYISIDGQSKRGVVYADNYIPTRCMNGVWYYSAEFVHNTYFGPVYTKKGVVALCDGTQDQYVPEA